jgi:TPR repeat protein
MRATPLCSIAMLVAAACWRARSFGSAIVGVALILALSISSSAAADPLEEGAAAYTAGDYASALAQLRPLAEQRDGRAALLLGFMYEYGQGVAANVVQAAKWYGVAAEQGIAPAQDMLGMMYADGMGVAADQAEAIAWYRKAAAQNHAGGQYNLGDMYARGRGVTRDFSVAASWFRKSAEQGYPLAEFALGSMYHYGRGVPKDDVEGARWWRRSAEQGYALAQCNLGGSYEKGWGVASDDVEAVKWYRLAAEGGDALCQYNLGLMHLVLDSINTMTYNVWRGMPGWCILSLSPPPRWWRYAQNKSVSDLSQQDGTSCAGSDGSKVYVTV